MNINDLLKNPDRKFILAYSDNPDGILHKFGTDSEEASSFVKETENKIEEMVKNFDDDTILIISADHGHKNIEKAYQDSLNEITGEAFWDGYLA